VGPKEDDVVRVKRKERRIYFKEQHLMIHCLNHYSKKDQDKIREFITNDNNCRYHGKQDGRDWFRCRYSISFDRFDEEVIEKWFGTSEDGVEEEGND
jgi:hypothetical protein